MGHTEASSKKKSVDHMNELLEVKEMLIPWPMYRDPLSPEELSTITPDSFTDTLSFLTGTREEAEAKYLDDVPKYFDKNCIKYCEGHQKENLITYLLSDQIKQTSLPKS